MPCHLRDLESSRSMRKTDISLFTELRPQELVVSSRDWPSGAPPPPPTTHTHTNTKLTGEATQKVPKHGAQVFLKRELISGFYVKTEVDQFLHLVLDSQN